MYRGLKDLVYLVPLFMAGVLLIGSAQMWWLVGREKEPTAADFRAAAKVTAIALALVQRRHLEEQIRRSGFGNHAQCALEVLEGSLQVTYLEAHGANERRVGQPIARRRDSVRWQGCVRWLRHGVQPLYLY